jgi:putative transposase
VQLACRALPVSRASYYRHRKKQQRQADTGEAEVVPKASPRRDPAGRGLSEQEEQTLLALLHSERFADQAPRAVYAILLSEGLY